MDDLQIILEEFEPTDHCTRDACRNVFGDTGAFEPVQGAGIHVFHAIIDTRLDEKSAIKVDDFWTC